MKNTKVTATKSATIYKSGKNAPVQVQQVPTRYKGGMNISQCQAMCKK